MSSQLNARSWNSSVTRNNSLIACLQASTEYLDHLLTLPSQELLSFTIHDFIRLFYVILILGRFASGCNCPTLDPAYLRKSANFEHYIIELMSMTEPLMTLPNGEERVDYFFHVRRMFQASQAWLNQISSGSLSATCKPELGFMGIFPTFVDEHVELSTTKYGCYMETGGKCVSLTDQEPRLETGDMNMSVIDLPTFVDPSLVMIGGNND